MGRRPTAVKTGAKQVGRSGAASSSWNARSQRRTSPSLATPAVTIASLAAHPGGRTPAGGSSMR